MAFGYQFSGDPSMQGPPMMSPHASASPAALGGDGAAKFGKAMGGKMKAAQAGPGAAPDPSGGAVDALSTADAGESPMQAPTVSPVAPAAGGSMASHGSGGAYGLGAVAPTVQVPPPTPMGYSAADMGAQAWQPRSAVGPRPFGF